MAQVSSAVFFYFFQLYVQLCYGNSTRTPCENV
uniref:Uncharacterized protein n=1 Tax=Anguilla anguilla TaxID=7936 RepID=A0A0E9UZ33_ANGAN